MVGGGVAIAVGPGLNGKLLCTGRECEIIFVEVDLQCRGAYARDTRSASLVVAAAYRPPNSGPEYMDSLCNEIQNMVGKNNNSTFWVGGDFNLPDINWGANSIVGHQYSHTISNMMITTLGETGLDQVVSFPTRRDRTLDLFLTNRPSCVNNCQSLPGISDHEIVLVESEIIPKRNRPVKRKIFLWGKADLEAIHREGTKMGEEFFSRFNCSSSVTAMWDFIQCKLTNILDIVPSKLTSTRFNQPWVTRKVKRLSRQKQRAYNKARNCRQKHSLRLWERYDALKKKMQRACREAYIEYVNNIICPDLQSNPKRFWSHISSKRNDSSGVAPLRSHDGSIYTGSKDKADILNRQFCSVFNREDDSLALPDLGPNTIPSMDHIKVTSNGVIKLLKKINPHKAAGPDNIPARLLRELADSLGPMLAVLFQASLDTGVLPSIWKSAIVAPVFKKGDRNSPSNYRPISLTVICCKLLEHIIHSSIMKHFILQNILTDFQHGFRKARSCESQLLITVDDIARNLDNGLQTDVVLLDFSKAFDKVPHQRLLHKLRHYGVTGNLLTWIGGFLQGRVQTVILEGESSQQSPVSSGVPQGTVLGPLLFLAYINDLPDCVSAGSRVRLFADDSVIYRVINSTEDAVKLQQDLDSLQHWESQWLMEFHPEKCQVLNITKRHNPVNFEYNIHGHPLQVVSEAKYLGVVLTNDLSWNRHIESTSMKGMRALSFLRRNLGSCPPKIKERCYNTFVRPILEYASCVWSPSTKKGVSKIESVQRSAARYVRNDYSRETSVTQLLRELGWESLQHRRDTAKVTMMFRIRNNQIDIPHDHLIPTARSLRGNTQKMMVPRTRTSLMKGSFFPDTIRLWNALPQQIVDSPTLEIFKDKIKEIKF